MFYYLFSSFGLVSTVYGTGYHMWDIKPENVAKTLKV
jgi:hypothetical protein